MKKILLTLMATIIFFTSSLVPIRNVQAAIFIPALANPATQGFIAKALTTAGVGALGIYALDDLKENVSVVYENSKELISNIGDSLVFATEYATDHAIPVMYEGAQNLINELYESLTDTIANVFIKNQTVEYLRYETTYSVDRDKYSTKLRPNEGYSLLINGETFSRFEVEYSYGDWRITLPQGKKYFPNTLNNDETFEIRFGNPDINLFLKIARDAGISLGIIKNNDLGTLNDVKTYAMDSFPSIDYQTPYYIPIPKGITNQKVGDIPSGTDVVYNPSLDQWETDAGIVIDPSIIDIFTPRTNVLMKDGQIVLDNLGNPVIVGETATGEWIDTSTGELVDVKTGEYIDTDTGTGIGTGIIGLIETIINLIKEILKWLDNFFTRLQELLINVLKTLFIPTAGYLTGELTALRTTITEKFPDIPIIVGVFEEIKTGIQSCVSDFNFDGRIFGVNVTFLDMNSVIEASKYYKPVMSAFMWFLTVAFAYRKVSTILFWGDKYDK